MRKSRAQCVMLFCGHTAFATLAVLAGRAFLRSGVPSVQFFAVALMFGAGVAWPALYEVFVGVADQGLRDSPAFSREWFPELTKTLGFVAGYVVYVIVSVIVALSLSSVSVDMMALYALGLSLLMTLGMLFAAVGVSSGLREVFAVGTDRWHSNVLFVGEGLLPILFGLAYAVFETGNAPTGPLVFIGRIAMVPLFWLLITPIAAHKWVEAEAERADVAGTLSDHDLRILTCRVQEASGPVPTGEAIESHACETVEPVHAVRDDELRRIGQKVNRLYFTYCWLGPGCIILIAWLGQLDGTFLALAMVAHLLVTIGLFAYPELLMTGPRFKFAWGARVAAVFLFLLGVVLDTSGLRFGGATDAVLSWMAMLGSGFVAAEYAVVIGLAGILLTLHIGKGLSVFYSRRVNYVSIAAIELFFISSLVFGVVQGIIQGTNLKVLDVTLAPDLQLRAIESVLFSTISLVLTVALVGVSVFTPRFRGRMDESA